MTPEMMQLAANMSAGAFALVVLAWTVKQLIELIKVAWLPQIPAEPEQEWGNDETTEPPKTRHGRQDV
jgi:hypothetical protein